MDHYVSIEKVIDPIVRHKLHDRTLAQIAADMHVSERHLQRLFTQWAGVSATQFLRYLSLQHAKKLLRQGDTVLTTAVRSGLSSGGRLYDLFMDIEGVTPGQYKSGGTQLEISYAFTQSIFGLCIIGATEHGVCAVLFCATKEAGTTALQERFPHARLRKRTTSLHEPVIAYLQGIAPDTKIRLHLRGTNFQVKVWEALLSIPEGQLCTYGTLAQRIGHPKSARAVGTAIGENPIGYLIPCHRVLRASGELGGYHWGPQRKQTMLAYEALRSGHA